MNKRQNRPIPELEIPDFKNYIDYDDGMDIERLLIPADVLLDLIQRDPAVEEQPEVWKMNASDFKRYLCEILELNYHTSQREIIEVISEKLEGLR